jgi:DNA-binding SARP family transcriptional activator
MTQRAPVTASAPLPLRLHLLQDFALYHGDTLVEVAPIAQRLIAFLALQGGRPVRRAWISGSLWMDASDARAAASLRSALWRCPTAGERPVVRSTLTHLALDPELRVDLQTMSARAHELLALPSLDAGGVDVGTELPPFADDVLVGWYDEWVVAERERFRQLRLHALDQIGELLLRSRRYSEAVEVGLVAVSSEPLRESAHRLLVRAHLCEGNLAEALRQYRSYADLLSRELGVRPSAAMEELVADALASASSPRWVKPRVPGRLAPTVTA